MPARQTSARSAIERAALVRPRPVADEIAEAPELVRRLRLDRREDRLQRVQVRVDVGDDCDAHRQRRTLARREQAPSPATSEVTKRSSPQSPAATPVTDRGASFRRPATTTPSSAGASRSSQPMKRGAEGRLLQARQGHAGGVGDGHLSSVFVACCTLGVPQTRTMSSAARRRDRPGSTTRARQSQWRRRPRGRRVRSARCLRRPARGRSRARPQPEPGRNRRPEPPARAAAESPPVARAPASRRSRAARAHAGPAARD